jgi:hypothetical protein
MQTITNIEVLYTTKLQILKCYMQQNYKYWSAIYNKITNIEVLYTAKLQILKCYI